VGGGLVSVFSGARTLAANRLELHTERAAAADAAEVLRSAFDGGPNEVRVKADETPVTEVDLAAEAVILERIRKDWPEHAIWSEEAGAGDLDSDWLWLVDPLDGTRSFIRRSPFFSTQIALMHRGALVAAVSSAPMFGETAWASLGGGAWLNDHRIEVSTTSALRGATLSTGNLHSLASDRRAWSAYGRLVQRVERLRGYGDFCHYHMLACGAVDAVIESDVNILDIAALTLIIHEAGGKVTQLDGAPLGLRSRDVLATNGLLHAPVRRVLDGKGP
jgi:histidinol-phosphatase